MSPGFRIFFLSLLLFGSVWIYRFRAIEIDQWLRPSPPLHSGDLDEPLVSRVNRIPALGEPLSRISLTGRNVAWRSGPEPGVEEPREGAQPSVELSEEEKLAPADLPIFETEGSADEAALEKPLEGSGEEGEAKEAPPGQEASGRPLPERPRTEAQRTEAHAPGDGDFDEILYTVQEGDSLWKIAQALLGEGSRYPEIRDLNRSALDAYNWDHLLAGTLLKVRIPPSRELSMEKGRTPQAPGSPRRYIR